MDEKPERRWYQVPIGRIVGAVCWLALSGGLIWLMQWYKAPDQNPPLLIGIIGTIYLSPFIAVGTLFGRPFRGLAVGVILGAAYVLAVYFAIDHGWIGFP